VRDNLLRPIEWEDNGKGTLRFEVESGSETGGIIIPPSLSRQQQLSSILNSAGAQ